MQAAKDAIVTVKNLNIDFFFYCRESVQILAKKVSESLILDFKLTYRLHDNIKNTCNFPATLMRKQQISAALLLNLLHLYLWFIQLF